jgi:23S rRNA pseudouridine1911/1915/1917 synthase
MSAPFEVLRVTLPAEAGQRLDKALAAVAPAGSGLSRTRVQALIGEGAVRLAGGGALTDPRLKVAGGEEVEVTLPPPAPVRAAAEDIPLAVVFEDADLIVIDKPAGLVVHPAPGAREGTLVNALLHHCGPSLSGVGGQMRPGIVHRIDKDTSGLLVAAKNDAAHQGLAAQFAAHDLERRYLAVTWGAPDASDPRLAGLPGVAWEVGGVLRIEGSLGRHPTDRKRMAVLAAGGRRAVTRARTVERFGDSARPRAALVECRLETGRTHQIRVHLAHVGHPLVGDGVYGRRRAGTDPALAGFPRQALHAATLGFRHPRGGAAMRFEAQPPADFTGLLAVLRRNDEMDAFKDPYRVLY